MNTKYLPAPNLRRGDIFFVSNTNAHGHEMRGNRPAVIVSNHRNNRSSRTVEVVYLTSSTSKKSLPTHVKLFSTGRESTALCEQVHTVDRTRLLDYMCTVTPNVMAEIDRALLVSLGLAPAGAGAQMENIA